MKGARRAAVLAALVTLPLGSIPAVAGAAAEGPVFVGGEAQPVFDPKDVVRESVWVRAPVDSDRDGHDDEVYAEVVRQTATDRGLKVPVVFFNSPYFSGGNDVANHDVDVELYVPNRRGGYDRRDGSVLKAEADERIAAAVGPSSEAVGGLGQVGPVGPVGQVGQVGQVGPNPVPIRSGRYEDYFLSRGFAMVYAESLGTGQSTGCPTSGGANETIGSKSVVDWLNGRTTARDAAGASVEADWTTGKVGMMGVSYNGTLPNAVASTGVEGLEAIVPIAAISSWYDYYRADGAVVAPGMFQGEDLDVLAEYVYTRADREICKPVIAEVAARQDRVTGDYSPFWNERNYVKDAAKVRAAVLAVHGLSDWNVKVKHVAQWYEALRRHGVEHKIWLHQSGHTDPDALRSVEWRRTINKWFSHYLYGVDNGIEREPKATIQREDKTTWVDEADWPAPGTAKARVYPWTGGSAKGALRFESVPGASVVESLRDDSSKFAEDLIDLPVSGNRLSYTTRPTVEPLRFSGAARVDLAVSFDRPAANVTALLVDRASDGTSRVITRGWTDPQNRVSPSRTQSVEPGKRYRVEVELEPNDYVVPTGHSVEFVLISSDHDYTLRPRAGTGLSVDLTSTVVELPVVGGPAALRRSVG